MPPPPRRREPLQDSARNMQDIHTSYDPRSLHDMRVGLDPNNSFSSQGAPPPNKVVPRGAHDYMAQGVRKTNDDAEEIARLKEELLMTGSRQFSLQQVCTCACVCLFVREKVVKTARRSGRVLKICRFFGGVDIYHTKTQEMHKSRTLKEELCLMSRSRCHHTQSPVCVFSADSLCWRKNTVRALGGDQCPERCDRHCSDCNS